MWNRKAIDQNNFNERMYHYFSMLYNKYRKPILPIAIFTYNEKRQEMDTYDMSFPFFDVLTFRFKTLNLKNLHWRSYIKSDNPVAAALLSKMDYTEKEKVEVKKEFLRMFLRMNLDPAKQRYIHGFFERYLKLTDEEEERLMDEIQKLDETEIIKLSELPISYEEKGKEIGKAKTLREVAKGMLEEGIPIETIAKITQLDKEEIKQLRK